MILQKKQAAIVIEEKNYSKKFLIDTVKNLYENKNRLQEFSQNVGKLSNVNSTKLIYDHIMNLLKTKNN